MKKFIPTVHTLGLRPMEKREREKRREEQRAITREKNRALQERKDNNEVSNCSM